MKSGKKLDLSLYLVLDANLCKTPEGMAETARKAVEGGCTVVQLRAPEWKKKKQLRAAFLLKELLKDTDVLFIVDDHIDIAWLRVPTVSTSDRKTSILSTSDSF